MQKSKIFLILLVLIAFFGFYLRTLDYDILPPFNETRDEFMYPWAGMSLIQTGIPTSWADFYSYKQRTPTIFWGLNFNLVTPWNEKPPLYPLLVGGWVLFNGATQFDQVRLSVIRQVPIFLNILSIIFLGLLAKELFGKKVGLVSAVLYATIPTIVMANRLSLIENLLIPLSLFTLWALYKFKEKPFMPYLVGLGCGLTLLTKNTGLALPLSIIFILFSQKQWKNIFIISVITGIFGIIHPILGYIYDWNLYLNLNNEYYNAMRLGVPETIVSLFRFPVIGHKEAIFLDGSMLAGWILLLSSPFWLFNRHPELTGDRHFELTGDRHPELVSGSNLTRSRNEFGMTKSSLFIYPYLFILQMCFVVGGQTWFGWHWFPVYPFLAIILALSFVELFEHPQIFKFIFFYIILAASSIRFIMLITKNLSLDWGKILGLIFVITTGLWLIPYLNRRVNPKLRKIVLFTLFIVFIAINIYTVINLKLIYPSLAQPLN